MRRKKYTEEQIMQVLKARGTVVNQPVLIRALKEGGMDCWRCLDVADPEPLPSDSELW